MLNDLTAAYVRSILDYDPVTGIFRWRVRMAARTCIGDTAGSINGKGRRCISIHGRSYLSNRLAYLYMTGQWPIAQVDHRNLDRLDDRWDNLRDATNSQNAMNKGVPSTNTSGLKGVHWKAANNKWQAQIKINGKVHYLGLFDTAEAGHAAYTAAAIRFFEEYARTR